MKVQQELEQRISNMRETMKAHAETGCADTEGDMSLQSAMLGTLLDGKGAWVPSTPDDWGMFSSSMDAAELITAAESLNLALANLLDFIRVHRQDGWVAARVRNYCWRISEEGFGTKLATNKEEFLTWFPEIGPQLFDHFQVRRIEITVLGKNNAPATFVLEG